MDPTSIAKQANSSNDFFLKDLFEIANSEKMVELSLSDKNTYKMNGKTVEETFGTPYDDDDSEIPVILYLRNVPFSHGQPGVNHFIYNKRADVMSKRLGYDY